MPTLSVPQARVFKCNKRFRVLVAGRRFGKTYLSVAELLRGASWPGFTAWLIAPTYRQAKQIAWRRLKEIARPLITKVNETDLSIELSTGGHIALRGADNYDSLRGVGLDGVVFDEAADIDKEVWSEVIRPALSDRLGWALFIGTPKGFGNNLYELYNAALDSPDWAAFKFTTLEGGNVPEAEVIAARAELDEKTFKQEYEASFENTGEGKVYYSFKREDNVRAIEYNPSLPLCLSTDYNVSPMSWIIAQIHDYAPNYLLSTKQTRQLHVLDEISLPDSNIELAANEFIRRVATYGRTGVIPLRIYGDSAGNARTHAGPSDYALLKQYLERSGRFQTQWFVPSSNPAIKDRVNAVNSLLCNADGDHRLLMDPKCKELIKDCEQVTWRMDSAGNSTGDMDKRDNKRTHSSDALGYLVSTEFSLTRTTGGYKSVRLV